MIQEISFLIFLIDERPAVFIQRRGPSSPDPNVFLNALFRVKGQSSRALDSVRTSIYPLLFHFSIPFPPRKSNKRIIHV
jgi:hypothetical protein